MWLAVCLSEYVRAHQVPITMEQPDHLELLEKWLKSYKPEELFDENGRLIPELEELAPVGDHRMGANPHANGGKLLRDLRLPDFKNYAIDVPVPGSVEAQDMIELGGFVRDIFKLNKEQRNFRIFGPDETMSNRLGKVFEETNRDWNAEAYDSDEFLANDGRVMDSMLSEHMCEGWLEGYLLTGRHGFFASYEAFIRIVDSMFSQHAKWLKVTSELPWRQKIASLNYILSSNVWQQDHNGFTHQDPGFLDHVANKKADVVRMYLPPDANCLLSCFDHCIKSRNYVNVIVASKHPRQQWLTMEQAVKHCTQGIGIWEWASNDQGQEPDVVMACCGDTPTLETLAAVTILRRELPELKIRVVNVVDLMKLQPHTEHPHGLTDAEYDTLFTKDKPIIFAYHGYPTLIHELTYRRHNRNLHVRGYKEEGTITTPFDMRVLNDIDRFDLVIDTVQRLPQLGNRGAYLIQKMNDKLVEHRQYIKDNGVDLPEVRAWKWNDEYRSGAASDPEGAVDDVDLKVRRRDLQGRTPNQRLYLKAIMGHDISFGVGPAGTGKTFLAVAAAVDAFERGTVERIVLTRPAVEAGERLGFLPGDLTQKVDPYLRPLYDALFDLMGFEKSQRLMERQSIEVAPLAYMRGRTLNNAFVILDEAQNTTPEQMKMFLTRIGFGSKAVITGDVTQIDLPKGVPSGLKHAIRILDGVRGIEITRFTSKDVVRHPLVARIVDAYEEAAKQDELAAKARKEVKE